MLTTLEVLIHPLQAKRTHLLTGYVHKPYPPRYVRLAKQAGYASAMIVRGVEGGIVPSLTQPSRYVRYDEQTQYQECRLDPGEFQIEQGVRMESLPDNSHEFLGQQQGFATVNVKNVAAYAAELGMAALQGETGPIRDSLIYAAAICLVHLGRDADFSQASARVRKVLDDGSAFQRFMFY